MNTKLYFNQNSVLLLSFLVTFLPLLLCEPILDNYPIKFQLNGATTYTPDSGGSPLNGYKLTIGYTNYQWLGIELVTNTGKNDVLILQINQFYIQGSTPLRTGHQVLISDYYRENNAIIQDQNTNNDMSSFNFVQTKQYSLDIIRYLNSNNGQDWDPISNKYTIQQICFYTSNKLFNVNNWLDGINACYYFEINNLISQFKGQYLKSMYINGYNTTIYGYIDGPFVSDNIYIYHNTPLFVYTRVPAIILELGTTLGDIGQDFNVYSPIPAESGDYYGNSVTNMNKDCSIAGGFQNNGLQLQYWNADPATQIAGLSQTTLRINYNRNVSTYDWYDRQLKSTFIFCLYFYAAGTINSLLTDKSCQVVQLSYSYPRMTMLVSYQYFNQVIIIVFIGFLCIFGLF